MTDRTADLENEVRRLRVRIIGLTLRQFDEEVGPAGSGTRRDAIVRALSEFSDIASGGRDVPELGDQSLADQVVVLVEHGANVAAGLPVDEREDLLRRLLEAAVRLRQGLA